jgi:hypothetical protein
MSYAIMRVAKVKTASDVAGIQGHNRRERVSRTNPDISYEYSQYNYDLTETPQKTYNALVDERIQEGYTLDKTIRKDAVRLCEMLFTSDNDFFDQLNEEQTKEYFSACLEWAKTTFGEKNIIYATVHVDEETPHLHLGIVPITKAGGLSANTIFDGRKAMQGYQNSFFDNVGVPWGLERGTVADLDDPEAPKPRKHLHHREFKKKMLNEYYELEEDLFWKRQEAEKLKHDHENMKHSLAQKQAELNRIAAEAARIAQNNAELDRRQKDLAEKEIELQRNLEAAEAQSKEIIAVAEIKAKDRAAVVYKENNDKFKASFESKATKLNAELNNLAKASLDGNTKAYYHQCKEMYEPYLAEHFGLNVTENNKWKQYYALCYLIKGKDMDVDLSDIIPADKYSPPNEAPFQSKAQGRT